MPDLMSEKYFPTLTPYIVVRDAKAAIAFYERALGAVARNVSFVPETDMVMNAQLVIGDSVLMLNDEFPDYGSFGPQEGSKNPVTIHINSKDVDTDFQRAVDAGAEVTMPLADMFWGDRYGAFKCPFGHNWSMGQKIREMTYEQINDEMKAAMQEPH
ncbi:MAG: VOC family protein [Fimbriimonadaceae bacterium]